MLSRAEISAILHPDPWFSRQAASLRTALVSEAQVIPVEAEHWIYDAGEDASGLYGVLTGSVSIYIGMEDETAALVNVVGPGHIFGYTLRPPLPVNRACCSICPSVALKQLHGNYQICGSGWLNFPRFMSSADFGWPS